MTQLMNERGMTDTLRAGHYKGVFIGAAPIEDTPFIWATFATSSGVHVEKIDATRTDMLGLTPNAEVEFDIKMSDGLGLIQRGQKYKLVDSRTKEKISGWIDLEDVLGVLRDKQIPLAFLTVTNVRPA